MVIFSRHKADLAGDTADADELKTVAAKYGKLGTLEVAIFRERDTGDAESQAPAYKITATVPEKALKGRSLNVTAQLVILEQLAYVYAHDF
jgi:hypothetical protein